MSDSTRPWRAALAAIVAALFAVASPAGAACERAAFSVLIDVGHTASAPGATSARGRTEYGFNLRLSAEIEAHLRAMGFRAARRLAASGERMSERASGIGAAGVDLLLSIHHDSVQPRYLEAWTFEGRQERYSDRFAGWSLFVSREGGQPAGSLRFARLLGEELLRRRLPFSHHHAEAIAGENRAFVDAARGVYRFDRLAVLRASDAPAALLEAGVIVNRDEEAKLAGPERQAVIAAAVGEAVERFCAASPPAR